MSTPRSVELNQNVRLAVGDQLVKGLANDHLDGFIVALRDRFRLAERLHGSIDHALGPAAELGDHQRILLIEGHNRDLALGIGVPGERSREHLTGGTEASKCRSKLGAITIDPTEGARCLLGSLLQISQDRILVLRVVREGEQSKRLRSRNVTRESARVQLGQIRQRVGSDMVRQLLVHSLDEGGIGERAEHLHSRSSNLAEESTIGDHTNGQSLFSLCKLVEMNQFFSMLVTEESDNNRVRFHSSSELFEGLAGQRDSGRSRALADPCTEGSSGAFTLVLKDGVTFEKLQGWETTNALCLSNSLVLGAINLGDENVLILELSCQDFVLGSQSLAMSTPGGVELNKSDRVL
mmetsp:Transcript_17503/g.44602  ORF Transcript_17503/g.44602 Transcript_17503/m.44602 type:complete len:351 (+) Transcript_17503:288-1340(+)